MLGFLSSRPTEKWYMALPSPDRQSPAHKCQNLKSKHILQKPKPPLPPSSSSLHSPPSPPGPTMPSCPPLQLPAIRCKKLLLTRKLPGRGYLLTAALISSPPPVLGPFHPQATHLVPPVHQGRPHNLDIWTLSINCLSRGSL